MKWTVMLIALAIGAATAASAAEEPSGFRNVRFGATEEQIKRAFPTVECRTYRTSERSCLLRTEIGDIPATVVFSLTPDNGVGRFKEAVISFKSQDYDVLRDAFIAKFGQPTGRVIAANEQCRWWLPRTIVHIQKYSPQLNGGIAALSTRETFDSSGKWQAERREKARRGL